MKNILVAILLFAAITAKAADWPREIDSPQGTITIYEPQIGSFNDNVMSARAAVSVAQPGKAEPVFGAVWLNCRVMTDRPTRTVTVQEVKVKQIRFPDGGGQDSAGISEALEQEMPRLELSFSLDELLQSLETAQKEKDNAHDIDVNPPKIIFMDRPAVLVLIDGDPAFTEIEGTEYRRVINTPFFLAEEPSSGRFFLRGGDIWYTAADLKGPWRQWGTPPQVLVTLSNQSLADNTSDENTKAKDIKAKTGKTPDIIVSTEPAELIATDGPVQMSPINGTGLLYASNTPSKLFLEIESQKYYILISGRWYEAKHTSGPWTYVASDKLPADFAKIPPGSDRDDVLANVAGTVPAKEAVLDSQIPQTAEVDRTTATTNVEYDGDPQFEPIENTEMAYALNSPTPVVRYAGLYYACDNGVWFYGQRPIGPWTVCVDVPPAIYTIPPRCPIYYVRYVRVYSYTPSAVYVGYTAGYTGCYVYHGTVVYGTGYRYRPWYRHYYYPRPWTWGFAVHYDPWSGWSMGFSTGWHPRGWFAYDRKVARPGWWGPVGYRPVYRPVTGPVYREGYHPVYRPTTQTAGRYEVGGPRTIGNVRATTMYDRWSKGVKRPTVGDMPKPVISAGRNPAGRTPGNDVRPPSRTPQTPPAPPVDVRQKGGRTETITPRPSTRENNVYVAPEGQILRKTPQGWQERQQNTWKDAGEVAKQNDVVREAEVRQRSADRVNSYRTPPQPQPAPKVQVREQPKEQPKPAPAPREQPKAPPRPNTERDKRGR